MQRLILCVAMILFMGCGGGEVSFAKIEDNLDNLNALNDKEITIAKRYLQGTKEANITLITTKELKEKLESSYNLQIIAVVPRGIYNLGFVKGAKNFEFNANFSGIWENDTSRPQDEFIDFLGDKQKEIIFYDNGDGSALVAALWAKNLGYTHVSILFGGFGTWKERGFEISFDMPKCCQM